MTSSPTETAPESIVPGDDAAIIALLGELVDVLHRHAEWRVDRRRLGVECVERLEHRGSVVPGQVGRARRDVVAAAAAGGDEALTAGCRPARGRRRTPRTIRSNTLRSHPTRSILFTSTASWRMPSSETMYPWRREFSWTPSCSVDDQQGRFGAGGAGNHVLQELDVAGRVEDEVRARSPS